MILFDEETEVTESSSVETVSINGGEPFAADDREAMRRALTPVVEKILTPAGFTETAKIDIEHRFTEAEKVKRGEETAEAEEEIRRQESILADLKLQEKAIKTRIEEDLADMRREIRITRRGTEMRDIECGVVRDFSTNRVGYISLESGECVKVRPMTADERQKQMKLDEQAKEPALVHVELMDAWEYERRENAAVIDAGDAGPECVEVEDGEDDSMDPNPDANDPS